MKTFGITFADFINKETHKNIFNKKFDMESIDLTGYESGIGELHPPSVWKTLGLKTLFFICIIVLISRVGTLQLMKGTYYRGLSDDNRIVRRPLQAARGVITDRNGQVLVRNEPYFQIKGSDRLMKSDQYAKTESTLSGEVRDSVIIKAIREYQHPQEFSHILGYISSITSEELKDNKKLTTEQKAKYNGYDLVGRTGVEEQYETFLKGVDGSELVEISSSGKIRKTLGIDESKPGNTVQTSIDAELQKYAYQQVSMTAQNEGAKSGVAVVQDTKTGAILSLVSYPGYDNNAFTHPERLEETSVFFQDSSMPLLNRAISGLYAPGSTFKMVTALAGLESNTISTDSTYEDTGKITLSGITFNNWYYSQYGKVEGNVDVRQALARSNDTFFYRLAIAMGPEKLVEEAHKFKMGQILGIDVPGEAKGLVPTPEWKLTQTKEPWYPGNTINMSIGQGDVLTTPLQIAMMTTLIANDGRSNIPSIVSQIRNSDNKVICKRDYENNKWEGDFCKSLNINPTEPIQLGVDKQYLDLIQEGMHRVTKTGGTGYPFFQFPIDSAGKTGTAETNPNDKPHAWYTGYAPYDNPEVTVTVLFEKGGEGSKVAAPVAKEIMNFYFQHKK
jgi:penicillin-binding protein 2